jgi:diguanylate cyclase (GGDEF)-like protein
MEDLDFLTNLLSRAAFDRSLALAIAEAGRLNEPLALAMADIDHFKNVNDGKGHQVGDAVLKAVSDRLARVIHHKGQVFRYGGEEFALLLPNHSIQEAIAVAERARVTIESTPAVEGLQVTVSFGIGAFPDARDADTLVRAADDALYDSKHRGRNTRLLQSARGVRDVPVPKSHEVCGRGGSPDPPVSARAAT